MALGSAPSSAAPPRPANGRIAARALSAILAAAVLAGCGVPTPVVIEITRVIVLTAAPLPTYTPYPTFTPYPSFTPIPQTATPTDSALRTKTPAPPTPTAPTATSTRRPTAAPTRVPRATAQPTGQSTSAFPTATQSGSGSTSSHGVTATFLLTYGRYTFTAGQRIWFRFVVTNNNPTPLEYGFIGVAVSNGDFHTSWKGSSLAAKGESNSTLSWVDWLAISTPGTYTLTLAMCFSSVETCQGQSGDWATMSPPITVTIN